MKKTKPKNKQSSPLKKAKPRASKESEKKRLNKERKVRPKDKTRSRASATKRATDIKKPRKREPVLFESPSTKDRLKKYIRSHRTAVAGAVIILAILLIVAGTSIGMIRARKAEQIVKDEATKANAVIEFLQETIGLANSLESIRPDVTVMETLNAAVSKIEKSFANQPEIEAAVREAIGMTYVQLERYKEAEQLLKQALEIRQSFLGEKHLDTMRSYKALGSFYIELGKLDEAEALTRKSLSLARKLLGNRHEQVGDSLLNLAGIVVLRGDLDEAESMYRKVLSIWKKDQDHLGVAWASSSLAGLLVKKEEYEEAEVLYQKALRIFREKEGAEYPMVATILHGLALLKKERDDCEAALSLLAEAIKIAEKSLGRKDISYINFVVTYGECLTNLKQYKEAENQLLSAYSVLKSRLDYGEWLKLKILRSLVNLYEVWGKARKAAEYRVILEKMNRKKD